MEISFHELANRFSWLRKKIKLVLASFLFSKFFMEKVKVHEVLLLLIIVISQQYNEASLQNYVTNIALGKNRWDIKLSLFKTDQK